MRWWFFVLLTFCSLSYSLSYNLIYSVGDDLAPLMWRYGTIEATTWDYQWQANGQTLWMQWPCCDTPHWFQQTARPGSAIAPFRYRVAIPSLVRLIPLPAVYAWQVWNVIMITALGTGMTAYLMHYENVSRTAALLGGYMVVGTVAVTRTALVPGIDISVMVIMLALMASVREGHALIFGLLSIVAVLSKEIFILAALLWLMAYPRRWRWALIPLTTFVLIRLFYGASPLEVNYGYDVMTQLHTILLRYARFTPVALGLFLFNLILGLNILWGGLTGQRQQAVVIIGLLLALFFLSSHLQRNLGIAAVVLIPPLVQRISHAS
jgi:hypothetical protein